MTNLVPHKPRWTLGEHTVTAVITRKLTKSAKLTLDRREGVQGCHSKDRVLGQEGGSQHNSSSVNQAAWQGHARHTDWHSPLTFAASSAQRTGRLPACLGKQSRSRRCTRPQSCTDRPPSRAPVNRRRGRLRIKSGGVDATQRRQYVRGQVNEAARVCCREVAHAVGLT